MGCLKKQSTGYLSLISFWAVLFGLVTLPCYVWATSITEKSAAIGHGCTARGDYSTAMGYHTTASGGIPSPWGLKPLPVDTAL
jgi:hypothetical protein